VPFFSFDLKRKAQSKFDVTQTMLTLFTQFAWKMTK